MPPRMTATAWAQGAKNASLCGGGVLLVLIAITGHAGDPDSLESATIKAAWLDECGQNGFRLASYEAILGRLSIHQGRVLLTSRPYTLGWMKQLLWDPWQAAQRNHPQIDIINFRSIDNPAFPKEEYYRAKKSMPPWRFSRASVAAATRSMQSAKI